LKVSLLGHGSPGPSLFGRNTTQFEFRRLVGNSGRLVENSLWIHLLDSDVLIFDGSELDLDAARDGLLEFMEVLFVE
jgi:hypothetical protein